MNPYVYSKKRKPAKALAEANCAGLLEHFMHASVGTALAFAITVFAAGGVGAITGLAYQEIANADLSGGVIQVAKAASPKVLGESVVNVIDDSALEAVDPSGALETKLGSFDSTSGRYSATITFKVNNLNSAATVSIGSYAVKSGINESGSVDISAILKPNKEYRVFLWTTDSLGVKQILARAVIKTGKNQQTRGEQEQINPCMLNNQSASSSKLSMKMVPKQEMMMCTKNSDGNVICPLPPKCGEKASTNTPTSIK